MHGNETHVMDAWDWLWMTPMMLSWIALIVLAVYVGVRLAKRSSAGLGVPSSRRRPI